MTRLTINQAKPNPLGKDRLGSVAPSSQLAGEWIDFKNTGNEGYSLDNIKLHHIAYTATYPSGVWEEVMGFSGNLGVGEIIRVHSGGEIPITSLHQVDRVGVNYHLFTGKNYVWNNDRSDTPRLVLKQNGKIYEIDKASYSTYSTEGKILKRVGNQLS